MIEYPLVPLRWNTFNARTDPRLQQQWFCQDGGVCWTEWRDVPAVEEEPGVKTPHGKSILD